MNYKIGTIISIINQDHLLIKTMSKGEPKILKKKIEFNSYRNVIHFRGRLIRGRFKIIFIRMISKLEEIIL